MARSEHVDVFELIGSLPAILKIIMLGAVIFQAGLFVWWGKMANKERLDAEAERKKYD